MRGPNQIDKEQIVHGLLQVTVAALSFWQLRKQAQRKQLQQQHQAFTSSAAALNPRRVPRQTGVDKREGLAAGAQERVQAKEQIKERNEAGSDAQADQKPHEDLRQETRPKALLHVAISAAKEWSAHRAASKGAALALYTLFSLAPMLLLVVTIAGFFFGEDTVRQNLLEQMSKLMGTEGADAVKTILGGAKNETGGLIAGLVSVALVLVSATSAFAELKDSLDELWEVPPSNQSGLWGFVKERILSFGLILVLALMLLMTLAVSTALATMEGVFGGGTTGTVLKTITMVISHAVSFVVVAGLFAVIFKYLPATKIAWKDVIIGALITAVLFILGKFAIGLYVANADISSSYGAAGSVVILITWIYYSAQIFFYGSLFTHEYAMKVGSRAGTSNAQQAKPLPANNGKPSPATSRNSIA
jgi:membrane protein